jgi:hypothetical protein
MCDRVGGCEQDFSGFRRGQVAGYFEYGYVPWDSIRDGWPNGISDSASHE